MKLIVFDKTKEYLKQIEEYKKKINYFTNFEIITLKEENIDKYKDNFIILLDEKGKELDSIEFSKLIKNTNKEIIFVVGKDYGIPKGIKGNYILSLSKMTMQHDLARLVLLEQIYRAYMIINNKNYHK